MNTHNKTLTIGIVFLAALILLALVVGFTNAQGVGPGQVADAQPQGPASVSVVAPGAIPIQGRLTNPSGTPLSGTYSIMFRLYEVDTGGTAVCTDTRSVSVVNGLFSDYMDNCYNDVTGQKLWLGVKVGSDPEMTPRQVIYSVPYALSLRPGAMISGTTYPILHVESTNTSGRALRAYASATSGTNYGVVGASSSPNGYGGHFYNSGGGTGLWGWTNATNRPAIFGCMNASSGSCDSGANPAGVIGKSASGDGVQGITADTAMRGVYGQNTGGGTAIAGYADSPSTTNHLYPTLYLVQADASGDFVVGASGYLGTRYWRVDRTGRGFFNGGTQTGGADFAEQISVHGHEADYEPGDVLVISDSADRTVELAAEPFATTVIGVYSTKPAVLAGAPDTDDPLEGIPVAITGIVPCKASAENGPIRRGDLLVTASTLGHAMRAGSNPPQGTVLGKAMGELAEGTGIILVLVTLQ